MNNNANWFGTLPEHWQVSTIGALYVVRNEKVSDRDYPPLSVTMKGVVPQLETAAKTDAHDDRKLVKKGDFAINSRSDRRGSCGISEYDGSVSLINTILTPRVKMNPHYYNLLFHTAEFADEFYKWGHGIVDDLWTTRWQEMKNICLPIPDLAEQETIYAFLSEKVAQIDSLIANQEKQIEKLKQYKQALITEVVTKGLDPTVPMKDSGVEWIGSIPNDWEIKRAKDIFTQRNEKGNSIELQLLSPTQHYGVIPQWLYDKLSGMRAVKLDLSIDLSDLKTIHKNDFCISLRSFQGGFEYCIYEGVVSPAYQVFYSKERIVEGYYKYLFKEKGFIEKMNSFTLSIRDGKNISFFSFANSKIPVPTINDQYTISTFLDNRIQQIDRLLSHRQSKIEKLNQYKQSLIYEYVTGKKKVI